MIILLIYISGSERMYSKTDSELSISNKLEGSEKNNLSTKEKVFQENSFKILTTSKIRCSTPHSSLETKSYHFAGTQLLEPKDKVGEASLFGCILSFLMCLRFNYRITFEGG